MFVEATHLMPPTTLFSVSKVLKGDIIRDDMINWLYKEASLSGAVVTFVEIFQWQWMVTYLTGVSAILI